MDNLCPLLKYTFIGLKQKIAENFHTNTLMGTEQQLKDIIWGGSELSFPLSFLRLTSSSIYQEGLRPNKLGSHGIVVEGDDDYSGVRIAIVPLLLEIEFNYMTDSFESALSFMATWVHTSIKNRLNYSLTYYGCDFDIGCIIDDNLSSPEVDKLSDTPFFYQYTGQLKLNTFVTNIDKRDMQEVPLIKTVHTASE